MRCFCVLHLVQSCNHLVWPAMLLHSWKDVWASGWGAHMPSWVHCAIILFLALIQWWDHKLSHPCYSCHCNTGICVVFTVTLPRQGSLAKLLMLLYFFAFRIQPITCVFVPTGVFQRISRGGSREAIGRWWNLSLCRRLMRRASFGENMRYRLPCTNLSQARGIPLSSETWWWLGYSVGSKALYDKPPYDKSSGSLLSCVVDWEIACVFGGKNRLECFSPTGKLIVKTTWQSGQVLPLVKEIVGTIDSVQGLPKVWMAHFIPFWICSSWKVLRKRENDSQKKLQV